MQFGVITEAFNRAAARGLGLAFENGLVRKTYLAVVRGDPGESGVIDYPVPRDEGGARARAITRFQRLAVFERYALVRAVPTTGRFHQIRRHMKHLSCPLIGDTTYGKSEHNRIWQERFGLSRLALHCQALEFPHPTSGEDTRIEAPLPEDFAAALERAFGPQRV